MPATTMTAWPRPLKPQGLALCSIRTMRCFWAGEKMETLLTFKTHYAQLFVPVASTTKKSGG